MFLSSTYDKTMGTYRISTADQIYIDCGKSIALANQLTDTLYTITDNLVKVPYAQQFFFVQIGKDFLHPF
ncbi:MAG: hypothetical protein IKY70_00860 [Bacteroidales bacterium]|nr:hypothetical protein [Bacteroidales bacterium]